ncbi:hypothetical protein DPMN_175524 [Dreissena polymorpha]|uniref:Uncharacterized protein n=1 Tax=Dreissena polymorpha TaxID=45954 RepID=A0A9D4E986_DREPO|nr:hypothetical protein DPMN_175524 [Dreissena polymorpha]
MLFSRSAVPCSSMFVIIFGQKIRHDPALVLEDLQFAMVAVVVQPLTHIEGRLAPCS